MEKMSFGEFLAECRTKQGLTQKELAAKLFVCESTVSKWEKDKRRPDLEFVSRLSEIFGITETELIRASIDKSRIVEKKQARNFRIINNTYNLILYIGFGIALLTCFIVNLAVSHTLSWFFIVLASLLLASIILILPQFVKKHRLLIIPLSWLLGLYILLTVVCVYTGGDWLMIPVLALLLAYSMIFTPLLINAYFDGALKKHAAFASILVDTLILCFMLMIIDIYTSITGIVSYGWFFTKALPIVLFWLVPTFATLVTLKKLKLNWSLKTSLIITFWFGAQYIFTFALAVVLGIEPDNAQFWKANFSDWSNENIISINVNLLVNIFISLLIIGFLTAGVMIKVKNSTVTKNNQITK